MVDTRPSLAEAPAAVPVKRDFSSGNYWNDRYASRVCVYDWFFDYSALRGLFSKYLPHSLPCLHLGCGNSDIQNGMAADGFVKVTNVDISGVVIQQLALAHEKEKEKEKEKQKQAPPPSPCIHFPPPPPLYFPITQVDISGVVIQQLALVDISGVVIQQLEVAHKKEKEKQKQAPSGPEDQDGPKCTVSGELEYITGDCRDMSGLASKSFGSCLDKGTLDALACSSSGSMDVSQYIAEVDRLLVPGGTFMLISLGGPKTRKKLLVPGGTFMLISLGGPKTRKKLLVPGGTFMLISLGGPKTRKKLLVPGGTFMLISLGGPKTRKKLLVPGGTFMLISLGGPEARKKSLSAPPLNDWASKLVLLPKPSDLLKSEAALKGVEVSSTNTNDRGDDIELLGPWTWLEAEEQMKDLTTKHYFFCYILTSATFSYTLVQMKDLASKHYFFCYILTKPVVGDISPSEVAESKAETVPTSQSAEVADAVPI
eukprot:gene4871-34634_t